MASLLPLAPLCCDEHLRTSTAMARGKGGTPRRNQSHLDDDYSPTSPSPSSNTNSPSRRTTASGPPPSSPARLNSPAPATAAPGLPAKPERGPTPLAAETTYHSRTRQLLVEHRKLRRQWNELVIRGLVGRTKAALELWVDVECVPLSLAPRPRSLPLAHLVLVLADSPSKPSTSRPRATRLRRPSARATSSPSRPSSRTRSPPSKPSLPRSCVPPPPLPPLLRPH